MNKQMKVIVSDGTMFMAMTNLDGGHIEEETLEIMATDIIRQIVVPAHFKGYNYLRYALVLSAKDSKMVVLATKLLYPAIADKYSTTVSKVKSDIRHAINVAWDRGELKNFCGYTATNKRKPTSIEFITMASDKLRFKLKMQNN